MERTGLRLFAVIAMAAASSNVVAQHVGTDRAPEDEVRTTSDQSATHRIGTDAAAYLAEALGHMRASYYARDTIDWPALIARAYDRAAGADLPIDTYEAIRGALGELSHSFLQISEERLELERRRRAERGLAPVASPQDREMASPFTGRREPEDHRHEASGGLVGRIVIPAFGGSPPAVARFADRVHGTVREIDEAGACGWIVDLRGNQGGNMWPMLVGIGPILGEGLVGSFELDGHAEGAWFYRGGVSGLEGPSGFVGAKLSGESYRLDVPPPVAVLIDDATGSSGEAVAIAFKGRADTRFFGMPSAGFSTSTRGYRLSDGANLVIAAGFNVDRTGRAYPAEVRPDVEIPSPATATGPDAQLDAALDWVGARCGASDAAAEGVSGVDAGRTPGR